MTIDPALDVSLVTVLFAAIDQMMVSHDSIDYDVEWPTDYAYMLNGACLTGAPRERRAGGLARSSECRHWRPPGDRLTALAVASHRLRSPALLIRAPPFPLAADRKSVRRTQTFTGGMMPDEARTVSSRSCFPFF